MRFGQIGGRYIRQLCDRCDLLVRWKVTYDEVPRSVEKTLIYEFETVYGKPHSRTAITDLRV